MSHVPPDLAARWYALWTRIYPGAKGQWLRTWFDRLVAAYSESHRAYHVLEHIGYCVYTLDQYRSLADDPDAIELAFWFHDAVFRVDDRPNGLPDNEALSADMADQMLREAECNLVFRQQVCDLILVTRHLPNSAKTKDEMLMADIDWSPMGWAWRFFVDSRTKIRREYAVVSDVKFAAGRRNFLAGALARDSMFYLLAFRDKYERTARENIRRELDES